MIQIKEFTFNHFQTNCYVLFDEATRECAIVDPCMEADYEERLLDQFVAAQHLTPTLLLLTHAHTDHICGVHHVADKYSLPITTHRDSLPWLQNAGGYGSVLGFNVSSLGHIDTKLIADGEVLTLGEGKIECRWVPGHCPGSMVFVLHKEQMAITGDTLFRMSIGRTDLEGGDFNQLMDRLKSQVLTLDHDFTILPGHGDCSSIAEEVNMNPFIV